MCSFLVMGVSQWAHRRSVKPWRNKITQWNTNLAPPSLPPPSLPPSLPPFLPPSVPLSLPPSLPPSVSEDLGGVSEWDSGWTEAPASSCHRWAVAVTTSRTDLATQVTYCHRNTLNGEVYSGPSRGLWCFELVMAANDACPHLLVSLCST